MTVNCESKNNNFIERSVSQHILGIVQHFCDTSSANTFTKNTLPKKIFVFTLICVQSKQQDIKMLNNEI